MYIAFKWLISLSMLMWIGMCGTEYWLAKYRNKLHSGNANFARFIYKSNTPNSLQIDLNVDNIKFCVSMQHIAFLSGILSVFLFNRKNELVMFLVKNTNKVRQFATSNSFCWKTKVPKFAAINIGAAKTKIFAAISGIISKCFENRDNVLYEPESETTLSLNSTLVKKVKVMAEERRYLSKLLLSTINENKNIKMQYQLETMARHRLARHVEDSQKLVKENRSKYFNFQQLYVVSNQENIGLKARIKKLTSDKDELERNLLSLVNEIYRSKDQKLREYCSCMILNTKNNLLNNDSRMDIQKYLGEAKPCDWLITKDNTKRKCKKPVPGCCNTIVAKYLIPNVSNGPKLRGLPGEYIWTVKDKYGMIEKLYEYESDFDNGDTIRRIREYTVYFDKDCIIDSSNSLLAAQSQIGSSRFVTESQAFKFFLQNSNGNIVSPPITRRTMLNG